MPNRPDAKQDLAGYQLVSCRSDVQVVEIILEINTEIASPGFVETCDLKICQMCNTACHAMLGLSRIWWDRVTELQSLCRFAQKYTADS